MTAKLPPQWAIDKAIEVYGEDEYTGTLHAAAQLIVAERETCRIEIVRLHRRVTEQRRELRRLNKFYRMYWNGFYKGMNAVETEALRIKISAVATEILRNKMIKAFGHPAVWAAEHE